MTLTLDPVTTRDRLDRYSLATLDLYKDIHKGIRSELTAACGTLASFDPGDVSAWCDIARQMDDLRALLESHARHEDSVIGGPLAQVAPALAQSIEVDHLALDGRFARLADIATSGASTAAVDRRRTAHVLYLELTAFTASYFEHQLVEEYEVMPALESAIGVPGVVELNQAILASIPPDEMSRSLAFMLPAMNVDDRVEMLGGMREGAPPEVFEGVVGLARSVLHPADFASVCARLGL